MAEVNRQAGRQIPQECRNSGLCTFLELFSEIIKSRIAFSLCYYCD